MHADLMNDETKRCKIGRTVFVELRVQVCGGGGGGGNLILTGVQHVGQKRFCGPGRQEDPRPQGPLFLEK